MMIEPDHDSLVGVVNLKYFIISREAFPAAGFWTMYGESVIAESLNLRV